MQLVFKARESEAHRLHDWALRRVALVLRRVAPRVSHACVQLSDVDGPRNGVDKRCHVAIVGVHGAPVIVTVTARDWRTALIQALACATEALKRKLGREQDGRRAARRFIRVVREGAGTGRAD